MKAHGNTARAADRVEALLRTPDAAPWKPAPETLRVRVMNAVASSPRAETESALAATGAWRWSVAAAVALGAGTLGLVVGATAWKGAADAPAPARTAADAAPRQDAPAPQTAEAPTVLLARAFGEMRPAGSARLVDAVAAPMRTEAQGLAAETTSAAKAVLSRLPFVSMD